MKVQKIAKPLINWYHKNGRHDLPWQKNPSSYRVWISEIMLQQTQVATVIPYYEKFMKRFPTIKSLALAPLDEVLSNWSGLGYYARARNLHQTAKILFELHRGEFPNTVEEIEKLPGIGRSTAGAILSFSKKTFAVILDGNVKRVLTRVFAFKEPLNKTAHINQLWAIATQLTPKENAHHYNQAMMDLGATVCTRTKPRCIVCPLKALCKAKQQGTQTEYPVKIVKKMRPQKSIRMLILQNNKHEVLLVKRPTKGIWGGLWSFPEQDMISGEILFPADNDALNIAIKAAKLLKTLPTIKHQFTHFTLEITPTLILSTPPNDKVTEHTHWHKLNNNLPGGIATPVSNILKSIT